MVTLNYDLDAIIGKSPWWDLTKLQLTNYEK
jgi:hypothetical protein